MSQLDIELNAEDGRQIHAVLFEPAESNGVVVQINSALLTPQQYYRQFAIYLSTRGFTVLTYDYRGLVKPGQDIRRERCTITDWGRFDQSAATAWLRNNYPKKKLTLLAHSLGGQIIGLSPLASEFRAILMIATAQGYWRRSPRLKQRMKQLLQWYLLAPPLLLIYGYLPGYWFGDMTLPPNVAWQMRRFCLNPHWICDEKGRSYRPFNDDVQVPLRHLLFADDEVVQRGTQMDLTDFYPNALAHEELHSPPDYGLETVGHFGFFRRAMPKAAWQDAGDWLLANA